MALRTQLLLHREADHSVTVHGFHAGCPVANAEMLIGTCPVGEEDDIIEVTYDNAADALAQAERDLGQPLRYCAGCCPNGALPWFTDEQWNSRGGERHV